MHLNSNLKPITSRYVTVICSYIQPLSAECAPRDKKKKKGKKIERGVTTETKCFSFYGGEAILTFYNYKQSFFSYKTAIASPL